MTDGLIEPEAFDGEPGQGVPASDSRLEPARRLEKLVARIPGARFVPARADGPHGDTAIILIDDADAFDDGSPVWLAVASGPQQRAALRLGATGIVEAGMDGKALKAAIEAARNGFSVLPAELLLTLMPPEPAHMSVSRAAVLGPNLTPREHAVLQLLSEGATNKMIARALDISVHTAKFHVASILDKLDAVTRTDAVAQGVRQGLLML